MSPPPWCRVRSPIDKMEVPGRERQQRSRLPPPGAPRLSPLHWSGRERTPSVTHQVITSVTHQLRRSPVGLTRFEGPLSVPAYVRHRAIPGPPPTLADAGLACARARSPSGPGLPHEARQSAHGTPPRCRSGRDRQSRGLPRCTRARPGLQRRRSPGAQGVPRRWARCLAGLTVPGHRHPGLPARQRSSCCRSNDLRIRWTLPLPSA